jgi:hypothetical protein
MKLLMLQIPVPVAAVPELQEADREKGSTHTHPVS